MEENQEKFAEKSGGGGGGSSSGGRGPVRTICVFCGSRPGNRPSFSAAALDLGAALFLNHSLAFSA
jgi:predicted Rossmann-fold nucleotide-binding protein